MVPYAGGDGHSYIFVPEENDDVGRGIDLELGKTMKLGGLAAIVSLVGGTAMFSGVYVYYYVKAYGIDQTLENIRNIF